MEKPSEEGVMSEAKWIKVDLKFLVEVRDRASYGKAVVPMLDEFLAAHEAEKAKWVPSVEEIIKIAKETGCVETSMNNGVACAWVAEDLGKFATALHEWLKGRM